MIIKWDEENHCAQVDLDDGDYMLWAEDSTICIQACYCKNKPEIINESLLDDEIET